jgi:hypothetical protein
MGLMHVGYLRMLTQKRVKEENREREGKGKGGRACVKTIEAYPVRI